MGARQRLVNGTGWWKGEVEGQGWENAREWVKNAYMIMIAMVTIEFR